MSKVNRSALKGLIKECLVEILIEGISSDTLQESVQPKRKQKKQVFQEEPPRSSTNPRSTASSRVDKLSGQNFKHMTSDDVMASIFADTAKTTLQEQAMGEKRRMPAGRLDSAARKVSENNLEDLFEGADKWASLAFSSKDRK